MLSLRVLPRGLKKSQFECVRKNQHNRNFHYKKFFIVKCFSKSLLVTIEIDVV